MKFVYDPEVDVLMVYLKRLADGETVHDTDEIAPGVVMDCDQEGNPIQFEILGASRRFGKEALEEFLISESLISLADAAKRANLSPSTLKNLVHSGRLRAKKIGRNWVTTERWLRDYLLGKKAPGRLPKVGNG